MKVLLIGNGGREHALARALKRTSPAVELIASPGNPGIDALADPIDFNGSDPAKHEDGDNIADIAASTGVKLVVTGPEAPLVAGIADAMRARSIPCFGPSRAAAQLEASKSFAKQVMHDAGVATAASQTCRTLDEVKDALALFGSPHVVKDDALAGGKGVVVTEDKNAAIEHAHQCLGRPQGAVVIEEYLDGPEVSLFCLSDGQRVIPLAPAQDFKRLNNNNEGPNTGGMGAYTPLPWLHEGIGQEVVDSVAQPVIDEMNKRGTPFIGLLYCGLAMTSRGMRVVEFNVRFGDPETQAVLERFDSPLVDYLHAAATGQLDTLPQPAWSDDAVATVVLASPGYPGKITTGVPITGIDRAEQIQGVHVIHAGTHKSALLEGELGDVVSSGGRVLDIVARGKDIDQARSRAYQAIDAIDFPQCQYRTDIATWPKDLQA